MNFTQYKLSCDNEKQGIPIKPARLEPRLSSFLHIYTADGRMSLI
jgi:hypothetical protein